MIASSPPSPTRNRSVPRAGLEDQPGKFDSANVKRIGGTAPATRTAGSRNFAYGIPCKRVILAAFGFNPSPKAAQAEGKKNRVARGYKVIGQCRIFREMSGTTSLAGCSKGIETFVGNGSMNGCYTSGSVIDPGFDKSSFVGALLLVSSVEAYERKAAVESE